MSRNRRKHARVAAKGIATHYRAGATTALAMPVENISLGGAFVRTDLPLPLGSALALELLDGTPDLPMKLTGRVVGVVNDEQGRRLGRPAGMGVMFDPLEANTRERLERMIQQLRERTHTGGAVVDQEMHSTRKEAFDFGFATLERYDDPNDALTDRSSWTPGRIPTPEPSSSPGRPAHAPKDVSPGRFERPTHPGPQRSPTPPQPQPVNRADARPLAEQEAPRRANQASSLDLAASPGIARPTPPPAPRAPTPPGNWQMPPPEGVRTPTPPPLRSVEVRVPAPPGQTAVPSEARLMVQVRGLLMELSDTQTRLSQKERENEQLREEIERLREQLRRGRY